MIDFENHVFQVTEINDCIGSLFDECFSFVRVEGEIVNISKSKNNHIYFALKDENSILNGVCWSNRASQLSGKIKEGARVCCSGSLTIYSKGSRYQLNVSDIVKRDDEGEFLLKLKRLREKLSKEGLFDIDRKKKLPEFPTRIALITSKNGSVIHDMLHRIRDRFPCEVIICDVSIQGEKAKGDIIKYVKSMDIGVADLAIIARGGGSNEDLSCFNDEGLVRAVSKAKIPIISAIGHEDDKTLLDYVVDLSAPTPTAAIELVLPVRSDVESFLNQQRRKFLYILNQKFSFLNIKVENFSRINRILQHKVDNLCVKFDLIANKMNFLIKENMSKIENQIQRYHMILERHDHNRILNLGYALVRQERRVVQDKKGLQKIKDFSIIFRDGEVLAKMVEE